MKVCSTLLLALLASAHTGPECGGLAEKATAAARAAYSELGGRQLEACSASADVLSKRRSVMLRFLPHESLERERHHWQVSCAETDEAGWSCAYLGITKTVLVRQPDDWAEILGPLEYQRAVQIANFALAQSRGGFSYRTSAGTSVTIHPEQLTDIDYIIEGGGEFVLAFAIPGEARACLQIVRQDDSFRIFSKFAC